MGICNSSSTSPESLDVHYELSSECMCIKSSQGNIKHFQHGLLEECLGQCALVCGYKTSLVYYGVP